VRWRSADAADTPQSEEVLQAVRRHVTGGRSYLHPSRDCLEKAPPGMSFKDANGKTRPLEDRYKVERVRINKQ
jgi:hypothetical protein